jgi:hypothetical protein
MLGTFDHACGESGVNVESFDERWLSHECLGSRDRFVLALEVADDSRARAWSAVAR